MNTANAERARRDPKYRLFYGSLPPDDPRFVPLDPAGWCRHLGGPTGETASCQGCNARKDVPLYACAAHGRTSLATLVGGAACCRVCPDRATTPPRPLPDDPACGVVVGCHRWPSAAELQVAAIRKHCGDVPVLLAVDPDPDHPEWPLRAARFLALGDRPGVTVSLAPGRLGHTEGDLRAFRDGLAWARQLGLDYVCKLSHRLVWVAGRWLQEGARALRPTGLPALACECLQDGKPRWPVRTESLLLDVRQWDAGAVRGGLPEVAEQTVWRVLRATGPGNYLPWHDLGAERCRRRPGYLWHWDSLADYWRLAQSLGVLLDADFDLRGSGRLPGYEP